MTVTVLASDGSPVEDVAVVLAPEAGGARRGAPRKARMDQIHRRFVPVVVVVDVGDSVEFPNSDSVSHQVYSFSPAKHFQLPLYKGALHPPVRFDQAGLVVVGCNIHDEMVGYILVADSPYHDETGTDGLARIGGVPAGRFRVTVWSPYIAAGDDAVLDTLVVAGTEPATLTVRLRKPLSRIPSPRPGLSGWDAY